MEDIGYKIKGVFFKRGKSFLYYLGSEIAVFHQKYSEYEKSTKSVTFQCTFTFISSIYIKNVSRSRPRSG